MELKDALEKYNAKKLTLEELVQVQQTSIRSGKPTEEIFVTLPLSTISMQHDKFIIFDETKHDNPRRQRTTSKLIKKYDTLDKVEDAYDKKEITEEEFQNMIEYNNFDKATGFWNKSIKYNPDSFIPNQSCATDYENRGFKSHPFKNPKGRLFQGAIKGAIRTAIQFAHNTWVKRYDEHCFEYGDPRLAELNKFTKEYIQTTIRDKEGHNMNRYDLFEKVVDLTFGLCKEDPIYRIMLFDFVNHFVGKEVFILTDFEKEHFKKWCNPQPIVPA